MARAHHTQRIELTLALLVAMAVAAVGSYDFFRKEPPSGLLGLGAELSFGLFLIGCAGAAVLASRLVALGSDPGRPAVRTALVLVSLCTVMFSDPTYASLIVTIPLVDIRRRDADPGRLLWTVATLGAVAALVIAEETRRTTTEIEGMLGLAIAMLVVVLLGEALRELDRAVSTETQFALLTERSRLAEEIHDSLGHHLLASSVQLQKAQALHDRDPVRSADAVGYASAAVAEAISETRLIVDATRHAEGLAVEASIRELAQRIVPAETAIQIHVAGDHDELAPLGRVAIYRVVQEALTNLVRHSGAATASISSTVGPEAATIVVVDDGAGFEVGELRGPGGINNMRRRVEELGGEFLIESSPAGTTVTATVPR